MQFKRLCFTAVEERFCVRINIERNQKLLFLIDLAAGYITILPIYVGLNIHSLISFKNMSKQSNRIF